MVRFKNRYITLEIEHIDKADKPMTLRVTAVQQVIQQKVEEMYGDFGAAAIKAGLNAKYCNIHTKIALVRCRHGPHKFLLNSVPLIDNIGGHRVKVNIIYIGATMKHCFLFLKKHQQKKLEEVWNTLRNDVERKRMEEALMTLTPATRYFS